MIKKIFKDNAKEIILFLLVFVLYFILNVAYTELTEDNMWNFHMIQKVNLGYVPYKDINVIITPLFHYLGSLFMEIFGQNFMAFYVLGTTICASITTVIYKILKKITNKKEFIILGMSVIIVLIATVVYPNYNLLIFIFPLFLIFLEWKRDKLLIAEENKKSKILDYVIGIIMALCFLTKQTVGGVFDFTYLIYLLIYDKIKFGKINWKSILRKAIGAMSLVIPFIIYLIATGSFMDFLDLCFGGIIDFGSKNAKGTLFRGELVFIFGIVFFSFLWFKNKKDTKILLLGLFSTASIIMAYPLANDYHIRLTLIIPIVTLVYILNIILSNLKKEGTKKYFLLISYFLGLTFLLSIIYGPDYISGFKVVKLPQGFEEYYGLNADESAFKEIEIVNNYIKQKEEEGYNVYIMSAAASKYMIPLQRNNNKYDLILQGNLGYKGEERLVEEIKKIQNPLFLKTDELIFQESIIVDEFIKENYAIVDKIGEFTVYAEK